MISEASPKDVKPKTHPTDLSVQEHAIGHYRSMSEESREPVHEATVKPVTPDNLGEAIHRRFAEIGGVDLDLPTREPMPEEPRVAEVDAKITNHLWPK